VLVWSDAEAVKAKAELAKQLGVRGIAIFKIDGGQDPALWSVLPAYKGTGSNSKALDLEVAKSEISGESSASADNQTVNPAHSETKSVPDQNLSPGMTGEGVKTLQKLLNTFGFMVASSGPGAPGNETQFFGNATYTALIKFQKAKGINPPVGHFGPLTRAAFKSI
jgi:peptidoglycan hydrolase-like protein with peptidoglycan-binding domain